MKRQHYFIFGLVLGSIITWNNMHAAGKGEQQPDPAPTGLPAAERDAYNQLLNLNTVHLGAFASGSPMSLNKEDAKKFKAELAAAQAAAAPEKPQSPSANRDGSETASADIHTQHSSCCAKCCQTCCTKALTWCVDYYTTTPAQFAAAVRDATKKAH